MRDQFLAQSSWRERRAVHDEVRLEDLLPSATVRVTPADAAEKLRALCSSGLFKFVGVPLQKQVESVTQWAEMLVCSRAPKFARYNSTPIARPGDQSFLLLLACGCRLQADKPSRGVLRWSGRLDQVALDGAALRHEED